MRMIASILFMLFGLFLIGLFFYQLYLVRKVRFETVFGKIQKSHIEEKYNKLADPKSAWSYKPVVEYEFEINSKRYTGNKIFAGMGFRTSDKWSMKQIVEKYPENKIVEIFYNPNNPENSFLEKKTYGGFYVLLFVGGLFLFIGSLMLFFGVLKA